MDFPHVFVRPSTPVCVRAVCVQVHDTCKVRVRVVSLYLDHEGYGLLDRCVSDSSGVRQCLQVVVGNVRVLYMYVCMYVCIYAYNQF